MKKLLPLLMLLSAPLVQAEEDSHNYNEYVTLYEHGETIGRTMQLNKSVPNLQDFNFDKIVSQIKIPQDWTVTLYDNKDYQGTALTLVNDSILYDYNDEAASIRIEKNKYKYKYKGLSRDKSIPDQNGMTNIHVGSFGGDAGTIASVCTKAIKELEQDQRAKYLKCRHNSNGDMWIYMSSNPIKVVSGEDTIYNFQSSK